MNLNDIIQTAQGGQAVDNLAARFGLSPAQAQSAINALLPAFEMGVQNKLQNGETGAVLSHLGPAGAQNTFNDASAAQSGTAAAQGTSILGSLFGGPHVTTQVAQQAANESGVSASVIQAMLPVLASIIMSGVFHSAQSGGLGGALSSILGSVFGGQGAGTVAGSTSGGEGGGLGGMLGSVLGGLLGGAGQQAPEATPSAGAGTPGSTLDELSRMFQAGTPSSPQHESELANILGR